MDHWEFSLLTQWKGDVFGIVRLLVSNIEISGSISCMYHGF